MKFKAQPDDILPPCVSTSRPLDPSAHSWIPTASKSTERCHSLQRSNCHIPRACCSSRLSPRPFTLLLPPAMSRTDCRRAMLARSCRIGSTLLSPVSLFAPAWQNSSLIFPAAVTTHGRTPSPPRATIQREITKRDQNRCCITGKAGTIWDPLLVVPILPTPCGWTANKVCECFWILPLQQEADDSSTSLASSTCLGSS